MSLRTPRKLLFRFKIKNHALIVIGPSEARDPNDVPAVSFVPDAPPGARFLLQIWRIFAWHDHGPGRTGIPDHDSWTDFLTF